MTRRGTIIRATGSWYEVDSDGQIITCRIRGRLRLKGVRSTNPVVVGDTVLLSDDARGEWSIDDIEQRRNYVIRRASNLSKESHIIAANIDRALLVVTLHSPATPVEFVDRFLVTCEAYKIPVTILLAKCDMEERTEGENRAFTEIYTSAGYSVLPVSALRGDGVAEVAGMMRTGTTLLSGNSGVGKSTLVRAICPEIEIRTGEISESHHKGRHTTTFSTMYTLPSGGRVIDTPGIKGFGLIDIDDAELWHYFPEMLSRGAGCRFYNCTHTHEPGCAVAEAVAAGEIAESRYMSYLKMMDEDEKYR